MKTRGELIEICRSKLWFESEKDAQMKATTLIRYLLLYPYQCAFCELWHLSSSKPDPRKSQGLRNFEKRYRESIKK